jgi:hypothetical protein
MQRSIARFLLFVALVGYLAPLTFAVTASPHACCLRKNVHHCHDFPVLEEQQLIARDASCCNNTCARAVTSTPWAHAQVREFASFTPKVDRIPFSSSPIIVTTAAFRFRSPRAPPQFSVA